MTSTTSVYGQAVAAVQIDNDRIRVTEWRFPPGTQTGWHRHELDYVVVPTIDGHMSYETAEEQVTKDLVVGASYAREAGAEHNVINKTDTEFAFIEIELKQQA
ncbi:cupin domain-containing protein [Arthrobacter sp. APC 3897]|uniref:cupin domain-containing protein n=1 Tax=Arthrobacter sp. APC 3897 TaxID=3035204 RepID=UPI0025B3057F|nr:cupin domain-containing protein [Arthrobacter sp. APC 3897]MDN3480922.1 cupin domain-containing protein [Arthrobacter sp. APC 3897]